MNSIVLIGANGKMGQIAKAAIENMPEFSIVHCAVRGENLAKILKSTKPDIALDLSNHESVTQNAWTIVEHNIKPLIGASGMSKEDIEKLKQICEQKKLGGLVVPNFSLAFAFINDMSKLLAKYYDDVSIVEYHHAEKKDKPSGTARNTAQILGLREDQIASVRAKGFLAKQQIYFQSDSERIIIDHESFSRKSFVKGIQLSVEKIMKLNSLYVGLESIL